MTLFFLPRITFFPILVTFAFVLAIYAVSLFFAKKFRLPVREVSVAQQEKPPSASSGRGLSGSQPKGQL
jgi:hypothetical protein